MRRNSKFKIGDFVQFVYSYEENSQKFRTVFKVTSIGTEYDYNTSEEIPALYNGEWNYRHDEPEWFAEENCEVWKPEEGEWCWFWDTLDNISAPRKFEKMDLVNPHLFQPKGSVMGFKYCKPFFGQLPSILEEE